MISKFNNAASSSDVKINSFVSLNEELKITASLASSFFISSSSSICLSSAIIFFNGHLKDKLIVRTKKSNIEKTYKIIKPTLPK